MLICKKATEGMSICRFYGQHSPFLAFKSPFKRSAFKRLQRHVDTGLHHHISLRLDAKQKNHKEEKSHKESLDYRKMPNFASKQKT